MRSLRTALLTLAALSASPLAAQELTLYSGRGETLVAPIIDTFTAQTGIEVKVRYGGTAELAILLQEEGDASPADLYWAQDVAALGAVADRLAALPQETLDKVAPVFRDADGRWIGISGRARVIAYSPERFDEGDFPQALADVTDEAYRGRMAVAPTNGSFVAHVAALRVAEGDEAALAWLEGIVANDPVIVSNNTAVYQAIADGEADFGLTNNYYLGRFLASDPEFPVSQTQFAAGDLGNLMMPAGIGIVEGSDNAAEATAFIDFLLSQTAQQYFTGNVYEYPVTGAGIVPVAGGSLGFAEAETNAPEFDVNSLTDLEGTLDLIRQAGLI